MTTNPVAERPPTDQQDAVATPGPRPQRIRSTPTISVEGVAWLVVLLATALFRLTALDALPLRPDESLRARAALDFAGGSPTAAWGGDLASALTALLFRLLGDTDLAARLAPALLGSAAVGVLWLYRPLIGRAAALIAAILLACSGVAVLGARSLGPESAALPLALLLPPLAGAIWLNGERRLLPLLALTVGFGLGTGAVFIATGVVVLAWLALELSWLDGRAARPATPAGWKPRLLVVSAIALLPGVLLAVTRYGAGLDRISLSAVLAWNGLPPEAAPRFPWHWPLDVLIAYEPLALLLGVAGAVVVVRRWAAPENATGRLALTWAAAGAILTAIWLNHDPALLLLLVVPLALLAGIATVAAFGRVSGLVVARSALALLPALVASGFALILLVRWALRQRIEGGDGLAVMLALIGAAVASGVLLWLLRGTATVALAMFAWLLLGGLTLHGASNAAFTGGSEFLAGQRTVPEVAALLQDVESSAAPGQRVSVDRRLAPALAWPLRDHPLREFAQATAQRPAVIALDGSGPAAEGARAAAPAVDRWYPKTWDALGILRWWVLRTPWGAPDATGASLFPE